MSIVPSWLLFFSKDVFSFPVSLCLSLLHNLRFKLLLIIIIIINSVKKKKEQEVRLIYFWHAMLPNRIFENYSHLHIPNKPSLLPCLPHILHVGLISRPLSLSHCGGTHVDALLNSFLPCSPNDRYSFDSFSQANWHRLYKKKFRSQIASFCLSEGKIQLNVCLYIL